MVIILAAIWVGPYTHTSDEEISPEEYRDLHFVLKWGLNDPEDPIVTPSQYAEIKRLIAEKIADDKITRKELDVIYEKIEAFLEKHSQKNAENIKLSLKTEVQKQ